jgi:nitrogen-specific signal transduction histidine kinase
VTTFSRVEEVAGQLRLMINSQDDLLMVMEKANRTLARINGSLESSFAKVFNLITDLEHSTVQEPTEELEEKNKLLENTLEAVVHEIRNPLMAIGGFAHRLAKNVEQRGDVIEYVHLITKESLRLEKVLKDLVAYSQIYKPFIITRNIIQVVEKVLAGEEDRLTEKDIHLIRLYRPAPILIPLDEAEFTKALQCLLETEIQLLEKMDRHLRIGLEEVLEKREVRISLSTKAGQFPEEIRHTLLGKDFSGKSFGMGLGLSLARKIIIAHGGRLELTLENDLNTLSVFLPASIG